MPKDEPTIAGRQAVLAMAPPLLHEEEPRAEPDEFQAVLTPGAGGRLARLIRGTLSGRGTVFAFAQTLTTQMIVLALNLVTGVLTARLLGPEGRGEFASFSIWPPFIASLAGAGISAALVHEIRRARREDRGTVLGAVLVLGLLLSTVAAIATQWLMPVFLSDRYLEEVIVLVPFAGAVSAMCLMTTVIRSAATAFGRFRSFNVASWADPALYCCALLTMAMWGPLDAATAVRCLWFATAVCFLGLVIHLFSFARVRLRGASAFLVPLSSYMARAAGGNILGTMVSHMDRLVLLVFLPAKEFGLYVVAYSLSRLLAVVHIPVGAVMLPAMTGQPAAAAGVLHRRAFHLVFCFVAIGSAIAWLLGHFALSLLYGAEFAAGQPILMILVLEAAVGCLYQVTAQLYLARGRPGFASLAHLVAFTALCVSLFTLVPLLGAVGAALAMLLSGLLQLAMLLLAMPSALGIARPGLSSIRADLSGAARELARL